ncbi:ADP compounds hydrolase NudE [Spongorhabdus nitratireducens]
MPVKPQIKARRIAARSRLFCVEELDLEFSNGEQRTYERLCRSHHDVQAIMVVAITANGDFLMVEEYAAGTEDYQLILPQGLVEPGEDILEGANRELKEEAGYGAHKLKPLPMLTISTYLEHTIQPVVATELYEEKLAGDEPEPLILHRFGFDQLDALISGGAVTDARVIATLLMVRNQIG